MNLSEMNQYLDILSERISQVYQVPRHEANILIELSPIRRLLEKDAEWVMHVPVGEWARLIFEYGKQK